MGLAAHRRRHEAMAAQKKNQAEKTVKKEAKEAVVVEVTEGDYELLAAKFDINVNKVKKLSKPDLQLKCTEFGISFVEDDTRAILFSKISCYIKGCEKAG